MSNSQIEPYSLSSWAKGKGLTHCFIYRGPSMIPTFRLGDFLYIRSTEKKLIPGDVVVFTSSDIHNYIVHRIVSSSEKGFFTRGDHNRLQDVSTITLEQIVGRVEVVENRHGLCRVVNGAPGLWVARIWQLVFGLDRLIRRLFWMPYNLIRERRFAVMFWRPKISKLQIQSENGQQIKYLYRNNTVATWDPSCQRFYCRKPFDLIIFPPEDLQ